MLTDGDGNVKHVLFGYVLALAAAQQQRLTVLDYGGNLGDYFWLAKALVPDSGPRLSLQGVAESGRGWAPNHSSRDLAHR